MIDKLSFEQWQQLECASLGISLKEHQKIVELAQEMSVAMDISFIVCYRGIKFAIKTKEENPDDNILLPSNLTRK